METLLRLGRSRHRRDQACLCSVTLFSVLVLGLLAEVALSSDLDQSNAEGRHGADGGDPGRHVAVVQSHSSFSHGHVASIHGWPSSGRYGLGLSPDHQTRFSAASSAVPLTICVWNGLAPEMGSRAARPRSRGIQREPWGRSPNTPPAEFAGTGVDITWQEFRIDVPCDNSCDNSWPSGPVSY